MGKTKTFRSSDGMRMERDKNIAKAKSDSARLKAFFAEETIGLHTAISQATGIAYGTLRKALSPKGDIGLLRLEQLLLLASAMNEDVIDLISRALSEQKAEKDEGEPEEEMEQLEDPALTLHNAHLPVSRDEYLNNVGLFIECVERSRVELTGEWRFFLDPVAREIDELREEDREAALWRAQASLTDLLQSQGMNRITDPKKFACYVARLGALGSVYRSLGRYQLAAIAIKTALRFLRPSQYQTVAGADLFMRTAAVLRDLQRPFRCVPLLLGAYRVMGAFGRPRDSTAALYGAANVYLFMGKVAEAYAALKTCRQSAASEGVSAGIKLQYAVMEIERGQYNAALYELRELLDWDLPWRHRSMVQWRLAVCLGMQEPGSADSTEAYNASLSQARAHLEPSDLFLVFFDYCEMLIQCGQVEDIPAIAQDLSHDVPRLGRGTHSSIIAAQFLEVACASAADLEVKAARRAFEEACFLGLGDDS